MKAHLDSSGTSSVEDRTEAVWRLRATRLSRRPLSATVGQDKLQALVLEVGDERYGIELADVAEVLEPVHCTPVPGAPPTIAGVINVHGEIRPVLDLARVLGIEVTAGGGLARVILLRRQGREMGLKVDRVQQTRWIASAELRPADSGHADLSARFLRAVTGDTLMLLSTEALFVELSKEASNI
jgi:purine-binding chemotaxis protein CheW